MNIIRKLAITISLLLFLAIGTVNAADNQTEPNTLISGTVTYCNSTEPFQGAIIDVKTPQGSTITSNITDQNGNYNLSFYSEDNTLIISAIAPGHIIPTQTISLDETRSATINFQLGTLTLTKGSWDTIGLDSNNVNQGPNQYLIQIRITNNALTTANNVTANLTWTTNNTYINLAPGETATKSIGDIPPGATIDAFYLIEITRTNAAYFTSRNYTVTVAGTNTPTDTITGNLYVEKLVSQNRNNIISITASNTTPAIGDIITITMVSSTASQYNIVNLPLAYNSTILQPLNLTTTYTTGTSNNIRLDNPGSTNFVSVWYFKVIGTGTTPLYGIITDQSGSSFHYNRDYGKNITITALILADLAITKAVNNTAPNLNELINFTITITNYGPNNATGVIVEDLLPNGLIFQNATPSKGTYNQLTGIWNVGTLNYLEIATLNITARVNQTGIIINKANITSNVTDPNPVNNNATATLNSPPASDLSIAKTVDKPEPYIGENILYTITVYNGGPVNAPNVIVEDLLPAGLILQVATPSQGIYNPLTGIWNVGTLNYLATATMTILAKVDTTGIITNKANVTSTNFDPNPGNNNATVDINPKPVADLRIVKTVTNSTPNLGDTVTFRVAVTNLGPSNATGITVTDILSEGLIYQSHSASQGTYNTTTGIWSIGTLNYLDTAFLNITVFVNKTGASNNTVFVQGNEFDPDITNNNAISTLNSVSADLGITKTADKMIINNGETTIITITVYNTGPNTPTNITVTDLLPTGISIIELNPSQGAYNLTTNTWNVGTLAPLESATLTMVIKALQPGYKTNIVSVTSELPDPVHEDNVAALTIEVKPSADLSVIKTVNDTNPNFGNLVKFTVTVTNLGPDNATNVVATDLPPTGLIIQNTTPSKGTYDPITGLWIIGPLNYLESAILNITAIVNQTGGIINYVSVSGAENDPDTTNNNALAALNVGAVADVAIAKTVDKTPINNGESTIFRITVTNNGPNTATNVTATDLIPSSLSIISYLPSQGTFNTTSGEWLIGTLAPYKYATLAIEILSTKTGISTNIVNVTASEFDPDPSDNNASVILKVNPSADIKVIKTVDNSTPNYGDEVTFRITVTNLGPDNATNIILEDKLPDGLIYQSHQTSQGTCYPLACIWMVGALNAGSSATLNFTVLVNTTESIINVAEVTGDEFDPDMTNNRAIAGVNAPKTSDLRITKTATPSIIYNGQNSTYTIKVYNAGPDNNTGVIVTDLMPAGLKFLNATTSHGTYNNNTDTWSIGDLEAFETATLDIIVKAISSGTFFNMASVTGDAYDPFTGDNNATFALTTLPVTDIKVEKTSNATTVNYNNTVKFTITVTNLGPDNSTGITLVDPLPPGLEMISATASTGIYTTINGAEWIIESLAQGENASLDIIARVVASNTTITNLVTVTKTNEFDNNTENNHANATILVPAAADLAIIKVANQTVVNYLDTVKFTLTVTNNGPDAATNVRVSDLLPAGLQFVSANSTDYNSTSGIWTIGELAKDAVASLEIIAKVVASNTSIDNVANVSSDIYDPDMSNNRANVTITVPAAADLAIIKVANQTVVNYLDTVKFTLTVTNNGPDAATNVRVSDLLPAGLQFVGALASQGTYNSGTGVWTLGDLASGAVASLQIIARVIVTNTTITNVAVVTSDVYDPDPSNNEASVTIKVMPGPPKPPKPGEIPMQPTGTPLYLMLLAVLSIIGGFAVSKKI
ncbi:MAG TPA: DUF11 domain-containing protein [Methanothermobacter sp.]|nr:DUF11 domain-containing protein [Methanothermobacter sp.]HPQ04751.1 DUF11 domain-containing protein [Methanothermobacter sp.]